MAPSPPHDDPLVLGGRTFRSRLFLGTGKYADFGVMRRAHAASGTECVTVAVRRINLPGGSLPNPKAAPGESLLDFVDRDRIQLLPNTAGCATADEAVRTAFLGREAGLSSWVKLEVIGDPATLYPDTEETVKAARVLVKEGFTVLAYTNDDLIAARKLEASGVASVMPLGAPIGSGLGVLNPLNIRFIVEAIRVPVIVDAGVGTASHVAQAFELGAAGVLLNTGIALAKDPVAMAHAVRCAAEAGRLAFRAGRMPPREFGSPSSPVEGRVSPSPVREVR